MMLMVLVVVVCGMRVKNLSRRKVRLLALDGLLLTSLSLERPEG